MCLPKDVKVRGHICVTQGRNDAALCGYCHWALTGPVGG